MERTLGRPPRELLVEFPGQVRRVRNVVPEPSWPRRPSAGVALPDNFRLGDEA